MTTMTTNICEICHRSWEAGNCAVQGITLYGYHTVANRIERTAPSEASQHICWDCARNIAIAFFCNKPEDFRLGDVVMPRRYGE